MKLPRRSDFGERRGKKGFLCAVKNDFYGLGRTSLNREDHGARALQHDGSLLNLVKVNVLNQWTYHARLYRAAEYVLDKDDINLVQLVSFGCGIDAITTDEMRSILENNGKLYTQIKIDEITNLGAVTIRLRSLLGALEQKEMGGKHGN